MNKTVAKVDIIIIDAFKLFNVIYWLNGISIRHDSVTCKWPCHKRAGVNHKLIRLATLKRVSNAKLIFPLVEIGRKYQR